jgi:hypothetical protein
MDPKSNATAPLFLSTVLHMTDNRKAGIALIAGSIGGIVTMAIHPTGSGVLTPAQFEHLAVASAIAHSLAMVSFLILVLGAFGLTRRLAAPDRLAFSGLVVYLFAAVAVLIATAVSGFIVPNIMRHMIRDTAAAAPQWHIVIDAIFQINQTFSRIFSIAASISIALWSASALRHGGLSRGIAIYGCIIAPLLILALSSGHLKLNVHGMAIVVFAQAIWFIAVGIQLRSDESPDPIAA